MEKGTLPYIAGSSLAFFGRPTGLAANLLPTRASRRPTNRLPPIGRPVRVQSRRVVKTSSSSLSASQSDHPSVPVGFLTGSGDNSNGSVRKPQ